MHFQVGLIESYKASEGFGVAMQFLDDQTVQFRHVRWQNSGLNGGLGCRSARRIWRSRARRFIFPRLGPPFVVPRCTNLSRHFGRQFALALSQALGMYAAVYVVSLEDNTSSFTCRSGQA
jgi:hypothetical protein